MKIKTSKKWTFVSQDINDNAPIFDRANYDVPVAQFSFIPMHSLDVLLEV